MKNCPNCDARLSEASFGRVRVDGCQSCGGVWFEHGELSAVAQSQEANLEAVEERFGKHGSAHPELQRMCPQCSVSLVEFEFKHSPGIKLSGCRQCKGIFVDDGELGAIHERLAAQAPEVQAPAVAPKEAKRQAGRQKAREGVGFLASLDCPSCRQSNSTSSVSCWACGATLVRARGFLCPR